MSSFIKDLSKIAKALNLAGFYSESRDISVVIKKSAEVNRSVQNFIDDLKKIIASREFVSKEDVIDIIDMLSTHGNYISPSVDNETINRINDPVFVLGENILSLENDISSAEDQLKNMDTNSEEYSVLLKEYNDDKRLLQDAYKQVKQWETGRREGDRKSYQRLMEFFNNRKSEI